MSDIKKTSYLSDAYWSRTDDKSKALYHLIRPLPKGSYTVDIRLEYLQDWILNQERDMLAVGGSFELCPDFQRGHVWNEKQQIAYCEALLGDKAPRNILFNCRMAKGRCLVKLFSHALVSSSKGHEVALDEIKKDITNLKQANGINA